MKIVISSGHGKKVPGAIGPKPWGLDEHAEAVRVVNKTAEYLRAAGVECTTYEDTISTSQNENLNRIVDFHNSKTRDLDVSVHFNAYETTSKPMGTECLYVTQQNLAFKVADALALAGGFINRGPKKRTDLFFLNNTAEPAVLVETCFVDSSADAQLYNARFDTVCRALAEALSDKTIGPSPQPPKPEPTPDDPTDVPLADRPELHKGDKGSDVEDLQELLNDRNDADLVADGDFGGLTDDAVREYQASRGLTVDGWAGEQTWSALYADKAPVPPPAPPPGALTLEQQAAIKRIANESNIAAYSWRDRGQAPRGYTQGMAVSFAQDYLRLIAEHPAVVKFTRARTNSDKDALNLYAQDYRRIGAASNEQGGLNVLINLYALMLGSGMRETSGEHCCGRDQSASNVSSDTAEAGLFQTSYNAAGASNPEFDDVMDEFTREHGYCYLEIFADGVSCSESDWECYGSGRGFQFQQLCKNCPMFAVETHALTLRSLCNHYGPIVRHEAELKSEALDLFEAVEAYMRNQETVA